MASKVSEALRSARSFAALPTIAGIVQLITKNTAIVYVGVTLSLLVVYSTIHKAKYEDSKHLTWTSFLD